MKPPNPEDQNVRGGEVAIPRHGRIRSNFQSGQQGMLSKARKLQAGLQSGQQPLEGSKHGAHLCRKNAWLSTRCEHTLPHTVET